MPDLGDYLLRVRQMRRKAGEHDCITIMANWLMECGWPDPMAERRRAYATEDEALAFIEDAGSLAELCTEYLGRIGMVETASPVAGDVGVISLDFLASHIGLDDSQRLGLQAGAIFTGERWAMALERGFAAIAISPLFVLKTWGAERG